MGFEAIQGLIGQIDETLAITDLSDVTAVTGTGTTVVFSASPTITGTLTTAAITASGVILGPNGSAAAPTYSFSSFGTSGIYGATNTIGFGINGNAQFVMNSGGTGFRLGASMGIGWSNTNSDATATIDLSLSRETTATLQMGVDVNGAAVAQTFKSHDGITGTDIAGANLILAGGRGTGAGAVGNLIFQTSSLLGSGTTAQTLATRLTLNSLTLTFADALDIAFNATTGTKFGTATSQKFAFWNATPVIQQAHIADPAGGATIDAEARTAINAINALCATLGLTAAS